MSLHMNIDPVLVEKVIATVRKEREMALSVREWKHRLAGYGYAIKDTAHGQMVMMLKTGDELCELPEALQT